MTLTWMSCYIHVHALYSVGERAQNHAVNGVPTSHMMVSMALTNQRRSSQGRKTSYGTERDVDLSTARSQNIKG